MKWSGTFIQRRRMTMKTTKPTSSSSRSTRTIPGSRALKGISDKALLSSIRKLSETERATVLSILVHLIEIDRRKLYLPRGYSSLFEFCVKHLGYSESMAGRRIAIARCIGDFPQTHALLASGRINLTNVAKITGIIAPENARKLLLEIEGRSNREVDLIVSRHKPKNMIRDRVHPVYVKTMLQVSDDPVTGGQAKSLDGRAESTPSAGSGKSPNSCRPSTKRWCFVDRSERIRSSFLRNSGPAPNSRKRKPATLPRRPQRSRNDNGGNHRSRNRPVISSRGYVTRSMPGTRDNVPMSLRGAGGAVRPGTCR
jgi:hypothetical protein